MQGRTHRVQSGVLRPGVKAVIFRSPCIALSKPQGCLSVTTAKCIGCKKCIREIGCPALSISGGKAVIDPAQCTGCGLCAQLCPVHAMEVSSRA